MDNEFLDSVLQKISEKKSYYMEDLESEYNNEIVLFKLRPAIQYLGEEGLIKTRLVGNQTWIELSPKGQRYVLNGGFSGEKILMPCWFITDSQRLQNRKDKKPYGDYSTDDYFELINRIDNVFIEGYIKRRDRGYQYLKDITERLSYITDFYERKKVYFTFDRVTLYELMEIYPNDPRPLRFILKRLDYPKFLNVNQTFMIMPFHDETLDNFYFSNIKGFLKNKLNIEIYRADDFRSNDIIINTIYKLIEESEFIIADTTKENKNSFYELGYAAAMGKEIITIQNKQIEQKLFFDRAHIRAILYDPTDAVTFQFELESYIKSIRERN
jgi:hypothetical protein